MGEEHRMADVQAAVLDLRVADAAAIASAAVTSALDYAAEKMGLGRQEVLGRLRTGDPSACGYCHYQLAKQVAESLGALDDNVKAVYVMDYDATPEDLCFCESLNTRLVHLIVWAQPKTEALGSLIAAIDRAVVKAYADRMDARRLTHLLDTQVVDDASVQASTGYGAVLSSPRHRPIQIWQR